jgi:MlaD protein
METRSNKFIVLVMTGFLLGTLLIFTLWLLDARDGDGNPYLIRFTGSVAGLEEGSPVTFSGVAAGHVTSIRFDKEDPSAVLVTVSLEPQIPIVAGVKASLATIGPGRNREHQPRRRHVWRAPDRCERRGASRHSRQGRRAPWRRRGPRRTGREDQPHRRFCFSQPRRRSAAAGQRSTGGACGKFRRLGRQGRIGIRRTYWRTRSRGSRGGRPAAIRRQRSTVESCPERPPRDRSRQGEPPVAERSRRSRAIDSARRGGSTHDPRHDCQTGPAA